MMSSTKSISLFCVIGAALNVLLCIMMLVYLRSAELGFFVTFCLSLYMVTVSGVLLGVVCAVRCSSLDFEMQYETYTEKILELKKRVEELEKKN